MKNLSAGVGLTLALCISSCASTPDVRVASQPDGTQCVTLRERLRPSEAEPTLLFHCAQSTLEAGGRYFHITGRSSSGPLSNSNQSFTTATVPESSVCFQRLPDPAREAGSYDSRLVILQADPVLRGRLSTPARQALEAIEAGRPR